MLESNEFDWDSITRQMSPEYVGRRIYTIRTDRGISMDYLAKMIQKSRSTVSRIERGTQELTVEQLYIIADILNIDYSELLSDDA